MVGATIGTKLTQLGHQVMMGSRSADNPKAVAWAQSAGTNASHGTFADAVAFGDMVVLATSGSGTLPAIEQAGAAGFAGKIVMDITNPLDFSKGMPPTLFVGGTDSLGEQVQRALPDARVVKTLNTVNCLVMVNPGQLKDGNADMLMSGDDADAKAGVRELLESFGWHRVIDLGGIATARNTEAFVLLWVNLMGALGTPSFGYKIVQ